VADVDISVHSGNSIASPVHARGTLSRFHAATASVLLPLGRAYPSLPLACGDGKALVLQAIGASMILTTERNAQHRQGTEVRAKFARLPFGISCCNQLDRSAGPCLFLVHLLSSGSIFSEIKRNDRGRDTRTTENKAQNVHVQNASFLE